MEKQNVFDLEAHRGPFYITYHYTEEVEIHEGEPDGFEDFSASAKFNVLARILLKTNEVREVTFSGEVFYVNEERYQGYIISFLKPGGDRIIRLEARGLGGKLTFGRALSLAIRDLLGQVDYYYNYTQAAIKLGAKSRFQSPE